MATIPAEEDMAYGVAKAAQDKLTRDLAFEFAPKGVRINSILPGERFMPAYSRPCKLVDFGPEDHFPIS